MSNATSHLWGLVASQPNCQELHIDPSQKLTYGTKLFDKTIKDSSHV